MAQQGPDITVSVPSNADDLLIVSFFNINTNEKIRSYETSISALPVEGELVYFRDIHTKGRTLDDVEAGREERNVDETKSYIVEERTFVFGDFEMDIIEEDRSDDMTVTGVDVYLTPFEKSNGEQTAEN